MRARFIHEGDECRVFGVVFARMEWVDVSHLPEDHRRKLAANPTFHVDEAGDTPALPIDCSAAGDTRSAAVPAAREASRRDAGATGSSRRPAKRRRAK